MLLPKAFNWQESSSYQGLLEPVEIVVPKGTLLNPDFMPETKIQPGVAGGNVEISQRLVDLIISSVFQITACSQEL